MGFVKRIVYRLLFREQQKELFRKQRKIDFLLNSWDINIYLQKEKVDELKCKLKYKDALIIKARAALDEIE